MFATRLPFFVYGTLIPGQPNDRYWQNAVRVAQPAVFKYGRLHAFETFPMLFESGPPHTVYGRLIEVEPAAYTAVLDRLDQLENYHPEKEAESAYLRRERTVFVGPDQTPTAAWVYLGQSAEGRQRPLVPHGDWVRYADSQEQSDQMREWWATRGIHLLFGKTNQAD